MPSIVLSLASLHLTTPLILLLLAIGGLMYLRQMLVTHAFSFAKIHTLAPLCYSTVVFSGLLGWLFA